MTPEEHERVADLFAAALEVNPEKRRAFLDEACPDKAVQDEVLSLLAADAQATKDHFLKDPLPAPPAVDDAVLLKLNERYQLLGEIGVGGMSRVYQARDRSTDERVAIKVLNPAVSADSMERFKEELRLARKITHKNVCRLHEFHPVETTAYLSMELIQGESLNQILPRSGGLPPTKAVGVALQICDGLEEAHRQGVLHLDLKPGNIMVDRDGNAKIMDFGIARSVERRAKDGAAVLGTPAYMAPEQIEGEDLDARTDLYAFGLILHEIFSGKPALAGVRGTSRDLDSSIPEPFSRIIRRCLEKNRDERYASVKELRAALAAASTSPGTAPFGRPRMKWAVMAVCLGAVFILLGSWLLRIPVLRHGDTVWDLAYSPDGRRLASAGEDKTIRIWDPVEHRETRALNGHRGAVTSLQFGPEGRMLVSGGTNNSVLIWDVDNEEESEALTGLPEPIEAVACSPDGRTVAYEGPDHAVVMWDVKNRRMLRSLQGHTSEIRSIAFNLDGSLLASGGEDGALILWEAGSGKKLHTLMGQGDWIEKVTFSPRGRWVASGGYNDEIKIWEVSSGDLYRSLVGHTKDVISLSFSPDEKWLVSASDDGSARIWSMETGKTTRAIEAGRGPVKAVAIRPDGRQLALGFFDGTIELHSFRP